MRAFVVGAGIAGLTAGYRLQQAGNQVTVFEASGEVGGRMTTVRRDGYTIDTGAGVLASSYRQMRGLAAEVGVGDQMVTTHDQVGVYRDGAVHRMRASVPADALRMGSISLRAKLEALKILRDSRRVAKKIDFGDLSGTAGEDLESVRQYADRRVSPELRDYLIDPLVRAYYQGTMDDLSSVDLFFIIQNFFGGTMMNSTTGLDFLPNALAAQLDVRLSARVTSVEEQTDGVTLTWTGDGHDERTEAADVCVIALTAGDMARIHPQLDAERRDIVAGLTYSTLWTMFLALDRRPAEPSLFIQVPTAEHPDLVGIVLDHNKIPGRTPPGKGLINTEWLTDWYDKREHLDDDEVVRDSLPGITRILPGIDEHIEFHHVTRWKPAVLLAKPGTWTALARFHQLTPRGGRIQFAGDYIGGSTTNSALSSGERAARLLAARER